MDKILSNLKRRLEKAELDHLREHARDLAERLEMAEEPARHAEDMADSYYEQHSNLIRSITEQEDVTVGLQKDGQIVIIDHRIPHIALIEMSDEQKEIIANVFPTPPRQGEIVVASIKNGWLQLETKASQ